MIPSKRTKEKVTSLTYATYLKAALYYALLHQSIFETVTVCDLKASNMVASRNILYLHAWSTYFKIE